MSADLLVIVDDDSDAFSYSPPGWIVYSLHYLYGYTSHRPWTTDGTFTFTFTFDGTSAAFIGDTSFSMTRSLNAIVRIDNGTPFSIYTGEPAYKQWFITPTLPDGRHSITINNTFGKAIDYVVAKVGKNTPLTGQTVIVDDDSSLIQYSGRWSRNTNNVTLARDLPTMCPYGNGTHRSSNPGDYFTFRFSGTSIAVYGLFPWDNVYSLLTATYSIDGTPHSSTVNSSWNYGEASNYLYFSLDNLLPGTHTLLVKITEANNRTFMLDYITYKPAFDTLSSMPSISAGINSTNGSSAADGSQHSVSTGAIVGGVFGGVAFGVLVTILVILFILRRRSRAQERNYADHDAALVGGLNDANIMNSTSLQMQQDQSPQPAIGGSSPSDPSSEVKLRD